MQSLVPFVRDPDDAPYDAMFDALRSALPNVDLQPLSAVPVERLADVTVAIVAGPSADQLASMPNLQLVQSTWAGVEAVLPAVPDGVEVARMVDPQLGLTMAEAVLAWTLYLHRDMPRYARQQRDGTWIEHEAVRASDRRIGILGLGVLGRVAAETLRDQRFDVAGWSRHPKAIDGVECFHDGAADGRGNGDGPGDGDGRGDGGGIDALLERSDIVVNLLPHTEATTGLLGSEALARLPSGASLINFGRGATVDDDALLAALDSGHLEHAVLDVFVTEPLPDDHPYWDHPRVTVLPHISGPTSTDTAALIAAENVRAFLADGTLPADALVDRTRGY